jgi:DNA recombination protein RmuC
MTDVLLIAGLVLQIGVIAAVVVMVLKLHAGPDWSDILAPLGERLDSLESQQERTERAVREECARARDGAASDGRLLREEVGKRLAAFTAQSGDAASKLRGDVAVQVQAFSEASVKSIGALGAQMSQRLGEVGSRVEALSKGNEERLERLRGVVDERLKLLQADNAAKLDQMRATVDEKLQKTLDQRLGESFRQVSERLEQVHKGLGEMQALSAGVTDLKRVMTNVKSRGTWAEYLLGNLLEDVLAPEQYCANFSAKERSREVVEFAVRLPGKGDDGQDEPVWLPIDSKFPREDYERLSEAAARADLAGVEEHGAALEARVKQCARDIRDKYINPPRTTDWAILFLPTEGLYAEVLRRPGLVATLQRDCRVSIAGPTTLAAYLNALQMGFRTLAIQKKSSEVWKVLSVVKRQFGDFGGLLEGVQKKLDEAASRLGDVTRKTGTISRSLERVEALPSGEGEVRAIEVKATVVPSDAGFLG